MSLPVAVAGGSALWYLSRGTGAVTLVLFTAVMVLGVMGPLRVSTPRWPRFAVDTLHRDLSLLAVALLALHVITSVLDSFAPIQLIDAVLPFTSPYRPLWLGLGAVGLDLMVAVLITSLVRRRLGYGTWRLIHWLSYASWPVAVLHGLGTGTDPKQWWMLALTALCLAAVVAAVTARVRRERRVEGLRGLAVGATVATAAGIVVFTLAGPLQPGWARRAGTPKTLLARSATRVPTSTVSQGRRLASVSPPFTARLAGELRSHAASGGALLDLNLRLSGGARGRLRIRMAGAPLAGGGLSLTGSQVDLVADGLPGVMDGRIVRLEGQSFLARVQGAGAPGLDLRGDLNLPSGSGPVSGTLRVSAAGSGG